MGVEIMKWYSFISNIKTIKYSVSDINLLVISIY